MPICEDTVIEFLTRNPDFLLRNPDLVRHIEVPHGFNGKTVSLIEHQAQLLRDRLRGIEQQYEGETLRSQAHRSLGFSRPETLHRLPAKSKGTCFVRSTRGDAACLPNC